MNSLFQNFSSGTHAQSSVDDHKGRSRPISWGAILAGASAALALHVLFVMLGAGLGLAIYSPLTEENPVSNFSIGALLIHSLSAIVSLWLGGWVAGRFSPSHARSTGWLHGFSVWCAATVGGVLLVALGAGALIGGLSKVVGGGVAAVGQSAGAVAGGATDLAANAMQQSGDTINSFVDEAVGNMAVDRPASDGIRATREVGLAVGRLLNPMQEGNTPANRSAAVSALVEHTEMSQAEADSTITEWTTTFESLQNDLAAAKEAAATQAREAADAAADAMATLSLWMFFGFLLGAIAATWGGQLGAICATKCEQPGGTSLADRDTSEIPNRAPDALI